VKIYLFNPETGVYLGEDFADENQLKRGDYLIPRDATTVAPPHVERGEAPVFDKREQRWQVRPLSALRSGLLSGKLNKNIPSEESL
jgi:hypothetical protein